MIEEFISLIPDSIRPRSGAVFYSGRSAFEAKSKVYILGLNPKGDPETQHDDTIAKDIAVTLASAADSSAYLASDWDRDKIQEAIKHLVQDGLALDLKRVPSSNVIFVRSNNELSLKPEKNDLLKACWPMHDAVIAMLGVRVVLCLGCTAGLWVSKKLETRPKRIDWFTEGNNRRWTSEAHENAAGQIVVTLMHPSRADWTMTATDPTELVKRMVARAG